MPIDWRDPESPITPHFKVKEALMLPKWNAYHLPTYTEQANIQILAHRMEAVREILKAPIRVHCWIRPLHANLHHPANGPTKQPHDGDNYNALVGGAAQSAHIIGSAVDFHVDGYSGFSGCHQVREILLPHLGDLDLRMEDIEGSWIHMDTRKPGVGGRFFKPYEHR